MNYNLILRISNLYYANIFCIMEDSFKYKVMIMIGIFEEDQRCKMAITAVIMMNK